MIKQLTAILRSLYETYFFESITRRAEREHRAQIGELFKVDNKIREVGTSNVFTVREADCGEALLEDQRGRLLKTSWFFPSGRLRLDVAPRWELLAA